MGLGLLGFRQKGFFRSEMKVANHQSPNALRPMLHAAKGKAPELKLNPAIKRKVRRQPHQSLSPCGL
jgi:hypothetical protein